MYSVVSETLAIHLRGTRGEPVDFARTIVSHGVAELPPNRVELEARTLETTLPVVRGACTVRITEQKGTLRIDIVAGSSGVRLREGLAETIRHMFRLDEDLSGFRRWSATTPSSAGASQAPAECCAPQPSLRTS
jgi:3-methyladenine DNA glycosylase/8-oxoguanine DNA glycosylase